jgi:hypothetical protein
MAGGRGASSTEYTVAASVPISLKRMREELKYIATEKAKYIRSKNSLHNSWILVGASAIISQRYAQLVTSTWLNQAFRMPKHVWKHSQLIANVYGSAVSLSNLKA